MTEGGFTVPLVAGTSADPRRVGGKAAGILKMLDAGLPVPPAFCITVDAYREHLASSGLAAMAAGAAQEADSAPEGRRDVPLARLRGAIVAAPLADPLRREIVERCRGLGPGPLAVRSSATFEDLPDYSFAGLHDTFFVGGPDSCVAKIAHCWASLWSERAFAYRCRNGFPHVAAGMAVLVQRMVPAEASGVLHTVDPVTGRADRIVVEGCLGLGESLVSGKVSPDRLVLDAGGGRIVERTTVRKPVEIVAAGTGLAERPVAEPRASAPCLPDPLASTLAAHAARAAARFGFPLDMEWAAAGGEIWFLQARPITALVPRRSSVNRQVWSNVNAGEILPDVVTPFYWSVIQVILGSLFGSIFGWVGVRFGGHPLVGRVAGRVYFNLNTFAAAIRAFPGLSSMDIGRVLGGSGAPDTGTGGIEIPTEDLPDVGVSRASALLRLPLLARQMILHSPGRGAAFVEGIEREGRVLSRIPPEALDEAGLVAAVDAVIGTIDRNAHGLAFALQAMAWYQALDRFCRRRLGDAEGAFANRLLAGVGGVASAEAGLDLWRLASAARRAPAVAGALRRAGHWAEARSSLLALPGGDGFLDAWDGFMERHGHHARGELDLFVPRWSECPDMILGQVRGLLDGDGVDPEERHRAAAAGRERLSRECLRRLRNPCARWWFGRLLRQAQEGSAVRENLKNAAVRWWMARLRALLLALGGRLAARGTLVGRDDVFFLTPEELRALATGDGVRDVGALIAERRMEYGQNLLLTPPPVVVGLYVPEDRDVPPRADAPRPGPVLSGLAVSPGKVTGTARLVTRRDESTALRPGEILVAPFADPGWTPWFLNAAAIVLDQGGLLSHSSIIAREYGIPSVVNVGSATRIISTGRRVTVDGTAGTVTVHPAGEAGRGVS